MRTGVDAATLALYESGEYDVHTRLKVANGSGTLLNLQGRYTKWDLQQPNPNAPIATLTVEFLREVRGSASSLAPLVQGSSYNKLDDALTYSALFQLGRANTFEIALTAVGADRPADGAATWYEVFRGIVTAVRWPEHRSHNVSVTFGDLAAKLSRSKSETAYTYAAGTSIEAAITAVLTNNGWGSITFSCPVATGKVLSATYAPGKQTRVWDQVWALAQSIGWLVWFRYTSTSTLALTLFSPERSKVVADLTQPAVFDWADMAVDDTEIGNVAFVVHTDENGVRREVGPLENAVSIAKYGDLRRAFWIVLNEDSPVRATADATALGNDALSDCSDPDTLAAATVPAPVFAESGVDLYTFPAAGNGRFFDTDQLMAPFGISIRAEAEADAAGRYAKGTLTLRGAPSAGTRVWLGKREIIPPEDARYRAVYNVREDEAQSTATHLAVVADVGPGVEEVWGAYDTFDRETDANWEAVAAATDYIADDMTVALMIPRPDEGDVVLLQLEGRYVDDATNELNSGPVHRSAWGAGGIREAQVQAAAAEVGGTATLWWSEQTAGVAVTARQVFYRIGRNGTRLGPFSPTRSAGGASTVQGGTLGSGEYEYDGTIPTSGFLVVEVDLTYATGRTRTEVVMPFDQGADPLILDCTVTGLVVKVVGDSDVKSVRIIGPAGSGYDTASDGATESWTVPVPATTAWWVDVRAYSVPASQQASASASQYDERRVYVDNGSAGLAAEWSTASAAAPALGDDVTITLQATAAPPSHTATLEMSKNIGEGWSAYADITASLSPALSTPPTVSTGYTWESGHNVQTPDPGDESLYRLAEFAFRATILDGSAAVVHQVEFYRSYYTNFA